MKSARSLVYGDIVIWVFYILLCVFSFIETFSASSLLAHKSANPLNPIFGHIFHLCIGFVLIICVSNIHYTKFKNLSYLLYVLIIAFMIYTKFFGTRVNDAARWVTIMGINIQPSEFVKIFLVMYLPSVLSSLDNEDQKQQKKIFWSTLLCIFLPICFTISENLSTVLLWIAITLIMFVIYRMNLLFMLKGLGIAIPAVALIVTIFVLFSPDTKFGHRASVWRSRVESFVKDDGIPSTTDKIPTKKYQSMHAKMGIANGCGSIKFWGKGPGNGVERNFLPEAYSDFIFAIIAEECGWAGIILIIICYFGILKRAGDMFGCCNSRYASGLIISSSVVIGIQSAINMLVAVGIFPVTGQTLPLISKGGSSIIVFSILIGIIQSVSKYATDIEFLNAEFKEDEKEEKI